MNRKKKIVQYSFLWLIFSFVILVVIGWGTVENGLIIYGFYFSWAYFILIYTFIQKLVARNKTIELVVYSILFIILILFNISLDGGIIDIIQFGKEFYPFVLR